MLQVFQSLSYVIRSIKLLKFAIFRLIILVLGASLMFGPDSYFCGYVVRTSEIDLCIKSKINNQRIVCCHKELANQTASDCFAVKDGTPYGGIQDSEQLCRDSIWGYLEYGARSCIHHMTSPRLDGLTQPFQDDNLVFP